MSVKCSLVRFDPFLLVKGFFGFLGFFFLDLSQFPPPSYHSQILMCTPSLSKLSRKYIYIWDAAKDRAFHLLLETPFMLMSSHKSIPLDIVIQLVTISLDYISIQAKFFKHPVWMFHSGGFLANVLFGLHSIEKL